MISVTEVQKAYLAYFGRPADPVGLAYWMNSDTAAMRAGFAASAEYATLYSGMTSEQRVEQIYQNLLGRASDAAGKAYWVAEFNAGRETVSSLVVSMQTNALGVDIGTIDNRVTYAILFTAQLDTPAEVVDYSGTAVADRARTDMSAVTYTDASLATARANITSNSVTVLGEEASPAPTPDTTAPTMSSAAVATNGQTIVVTYSEALTGTAEAGDYAVTLSANTTTVTGAAIGVGADANKVTLTLSNTIPSGVLVTDLVYDATAGTANSIKDAASNSAATQTLAAVTNNSTATNLSFTLTTANDSFTGGVGDDTFGGTWTDGDAASTLDVGDVLNGGGGTDTLNISSASVGAITLTDANWVLGGVNALIENITVTNGAGAGAIGFATGANFNTAFSVGGVDLTTSVGAGATTIDMATVAFTGAADIIATASGAGDMTITSGSGAATVNSTTFAGAQTINGTGLTSVTLISTGAGIQTVGSVGATNNLVTINATQNGAGNQVLTSTSASAVTVTATQNASATAGNQLITTGAGNDNVTVTTDVAATNVITTNGGDDTILLLGTSVAATGTTITGGTGADNITLVSTGSGFSAPDTIVIATADVGATWATADTITNFVTIVDRLNLDVAADGANYTAASEADGIGMADEAAVLAAAQAVLDGIVQYYFAYNINGSGSGALYFDADGVDGGEDVILLAGASTAGFLILGDII